MACAGCTPGGAQREGRAPCGRTNGLTLLPDSNAPAIPIRFYRARSARGMPGSGLGLAIVRQVAEAHGGSVVAERAEGGGTRMTLRLNGARAPNS